MRTECLGLLFGLLMNSTTSALKAIGSIISSGHDGSVDVKTNRLHNVSGGASAKDLIRPEA